MNSPAIGELNDEFSIQDGNNSLHFENGTGDIPVAVIKNEQAKAVISLQGAQLLSWVPAAGDEMIWVSPDACFMPGKSVRGGVPVCWPWFGAHVSNPDLPAHGFARTSLWRVADVGVTITGESEITFRLDSRTLTDAVQAMWPQATTLDLSLTLGTSLQLALTSTNHSDQDMKITQALHTYFAIDDIASTLVYGLEGRDYLDKSDGFSRKTQDGPVVINTEVDRVYLQTADDVMIDDNKRKILIKKQGSQTTVVWNPWQAVAEKMGDLGKDGYRKMVCVESANAADDVVVLEPGGRHTLSVTYSLG